MTGAESDWVCQLGICDRGTIWLDNWKTFGVRCPSCDPVRDQDLEAVLRETIMPGLVRLGIYSQTRADEMRVRFMETVRRPRQ